MRLAILALGAAGLAGCSWNGAGHAPGLQSGCQVFGQTVPAQGYTHQGYVQSAYAPQPAYAGGGCHGVQGGYSSYSAPGFAQAAHTQYAPTQYASASGAVASGYATSGYGVASAGATASATVPGTVLGSTAPYGSAVTSQYGSTATFAPSPAYQAPEVRTVVGEPLYVPQPYPVPANPACCGAPAPVRASYGGGIMPYGAELFAGTELAAGGDIFTKKSDGPPDGDFSQPLRVGEIDPIGYDDAFGATQTIGGALTYDLSPNTTILGSIAYGKAKGQTVDRYTTVQNGVWNNGSFTPDPGSTPLALDGTFTDLETTTVEAGVRHYVGHPAKLRPYIGATGGAVRNNTVRFTQTFSDTGAYYGEREFVSSGWNPTASATVGAEMALGPRSAIGIESGLRWRASMDTAAPSDDRLTIPVTLRGRLSF